MLQISGDFARRDSAGPRRGGPRGRGEPRVPPPTAGDGSGPRNDRPGGDRGAARRSAPHRGPRRAVVDPSRGGRSHPGRAAMTQPSCHGERSHPGALHDPIPTRPQLVLAGNPNVGKTTLFNALTGSSAKVSNYPGITVEAACGALTLPGGRIADLRDLPGTYSVNARSAEEQIALDALIGLAGAPTPDAVIVCVDATQVARAAYLLLQCQELGARCVVALTMVDEAGAAAPDPRALAGALGCEVVAVTARTGAGLDELRAAIDRALRAERRAQWHWQPDRALRARIDAVAGALPAPWRSATRYGAALSGADDALALWALTCVEPRTGSSDDDELVVPDAVRAAVVAEPAPRDDEAV